MMIAMFFDVLLMCDGQGHSLDVFLFYLIVCVLHFISCVSLLDCSVKRKVTSYLM